MMRSRFAFVMAIVLTMFAIEMPAHAQGKDQQSHGNGRGHGTPNQSILPAPTSISGSTGGSAPFAWVDNANLMTPGSMWLGVSMVRWQGTDVSELSLPVVDAAIGLAPRVQLGASVPRVAGSADPSKPEGGLGTTFLNAKIGILPDNRSGVKVAVAPTVEILSAAAMQSASIGQGRAQWGLPVSAGFDRGALAIYTSAGYFSPGVWYAGAGAGGQIGSRVGVALSLSRSWATSTSSTIETAIPRPSRNDLSGGVSVDVTPNVGIFGSVGRTIATAQENGAGTTISVGLSLTARSVTIKK
jgi:hypothetical protein